MQKAHGYRKLERTLVIDSRVRTVAQTQNNVTRRQTSAVGIPEDENYDVRSIVVGSDGYQLPASKGLLYIDVAYPLDVQIGTATIRVTGQLTITGAVPAVVLVSEDPQAVNVIQY